MMKLSRTIIVWMALLTLTGCADSHPASENTDTATDDSAMDDTDTVTDSADVFPVDSDSDTEAADTDTATEDTSSPELLVAEIIDAMVLANDYFMEKWPDPGVDIVTDKARPSNLWTRAVYYEGLMALNKTAPSAAYIDYATTWGESHDWNVTFGNTGTRDADHQCCGQTYIDLSNLGVESAQVTNIATCIDNVVASSVSDDWWWIDAIQMAMPVYALLGNLTGDTAYFEKMYDLYHHTKTIEGGGLYNTEDDLWWRDADFVPPHTAPNGEDEYWSRGNGWVYAALVRVLEILPETDPHLEEYLSDFSAMSEALRAVRRDDGFWNVSLHDPDDYGGKELTGTALFVYGMAWGVRHGHLNTDVYRPLVEESWRALVSDCLHDDGFLGYVQGTGKQPSDGQPVTYDNVPNFEDYGLGCFLLAGSEVTKLVQKK